MKTINLPPYAPTLIESTRAIGYSLEAAVADIIDNSIAANASKVDLYFFPVDGEYVAVLDNGDGMDADTINIAMQYGSKNPLEARSVNDLGRFGLGLKTASLSQCKMLTVISKANGNIEARRWDVDYVAQTGEWSLLSLDYDEVQACPHFSDLDQYKSGTLVIWQNLDRLKAGELNFEQALGRKMDGVREHLSLVFHRYLSGETGIKRLTITINGLIVKATDPFLSVKSEQAMDDETIIVQGERILVRPYILPHSSKMTAEELKMLGGKEGLRKQQGFYVYRNKRLLVWGTWFRMMRQGEMSKLVRIRVDIPNALDDLWTLDIKKSSAVPPAEVRMNLKNVIDRMAEKSKRTWTTRGKKETASEITHVWNRLRTRNGGFIYEINREYPLIFEYIEQYPEQKNKIEMIIQQIESNIPLNALYLDLTNDEKVENETDYKETEIISMVRNVLSSLDESARSSMLESLLSSEPFNEYEVQIRNAYEKGKLI